jgi:hypothetical protein
VRVLLDEFVPRRLKHELVGHDVRAAPEMGSASKPRRVTTARRARIRLFLTVDRKLQHQQSLSTLRIAIIVMLARTNTLLDLRPLIPDVVQTLLTVKPGQTVVVGE